MTVTLQIAEVLLLIESYLNHCCPLGASMSDLTDIMREYAKSAYVTAPLLFLPSTASALPHPENQCVDRDISLLVGAVGGLVGATVVSLLRDNYNSSGNYRKGINASLYFTGTLAGVTACLLWSIK